MTQTGSTRPTRYQHFCGDPTRRCTFPPDGMCGPWSCAIILFFLIGLLLSMAGLRRGGVRPPCPAPTLTWGRARLAAARAGLLLALPGDEARAFAAPEPATVRLSCLAVTFSTAARPWPGDVFVYGCAVRPEAWLEDP